MAHRCCLWLFVVLYLLLADLYALYDLLYRLFARQTPCITYKLLSLLNYLVSKLSDMITYYRMENWTNFTQMSKSWDTVQVSTPDSTAILMLVWHFSTRSRKMR